MVETYRGWFWKRVVRARTPVTFLISVADNTRWPLRLASIVASCSRLKRRISWPAENTASNTDTGQATNALRKRVWSRKIYSQDCR